MGWKGVEITAINRLTHNLGKQDRKSPFLFIVVCVFFTIKKIIKNNVSTNDIVVLLLCFCVLLLFFNQ